MKRPSVILSSLIIFCLFNSPAFALSERCSEIGKKSGLDLNEAECYVLEKVERGKVANFKISDD